MAQDKRLRYSCAMSEMGVSEAAVLLDLHPSRVRALAAKGAVPARQVAGRWLVDVEAVQARAQNGALAVRPMAPATAWAAAALADGRRAPWLTATDRSRLKRRMREHRDDDVQRWQAWLQRRAIRHEYRVDDHGLEQLVCDQRVCLGGVSAAPYVGLDVVAPGQVELYVAVDSLDSLVEDHFLLSSSRPNVVLRAVPGGWHLLAATSHGGVRVAPRLAVMVDLLEAHDARSNRAAGQLLHDIVNGEQSAGW
jgi:hypothetical protein